MILNVCGFGWSGSGAYIDLLREYEEVTFPTSDTWEFNFIWAPDGLYDLEQKLCVKHCRIFDSFLAIERFLEIAKQYGDKKGPFKYDKYLSSPFYNQCLNYIDKLTQFQLETNCYVHKLHPKTKDKLIMYVNRWLGYLFRNRYVRKYECMKDIYNSIKLNNYKKIAVSYNPDNFIEVTQDFIESIINQIRKERNKLLVLDQSVPPDVPQLFDHFFKEEHKTIIVRRDPRDNFITINELKGIGRPVPTNVDDYIHFYKKTIAETRLPDSETTLSLNFEDLIYNYDNTVKRIEDFVGVKSHLKKNIFFIREKSINNTQLINLFPKYQKDIIKIEKELCEYIYTFPQNYNRSSNNIF